MTTLSDPDKHFFVHGGPALASLEDLFSHLQEMEDWQFSHHVNEGRHDFARWINDCFDDRFLAKRVSQTQNIEDLQRTIFISLFR